VSKFGDYQVGDTYTIFEHDGYKFGVTICWENLFPQHVRQFVKNGAQFMVNITNEAWFGRTAAPHQFTSMSVMRAVENRIYMVRCTNTGISCVIDPYGRIVASLKGDDGQALFVRGTLNAPVVATTANTLFTRLGDWPIPVSLVVFLVIFGIAIFGKIRKNRNTG
jgi:apolipoprotein N-acyltransferase